MPEPDDRADSVFAIPFHRFLGIRPIDPARPAHGIVLPATGAAVNNAGVVHGGIITALLDVASYLAILPHLEPGQNAVTHDATASLMRPVPAEAEVRLTGTVVRCGRTLAFLRAEATVDEVAVAFGQVTKSLVAGHRASRT